MTKIKIIKNKGQWHCRIIASNGELLYHSERFTRKANAYKNITSLLMGLSRRICIEDNLGCCFEGGLAEVVFHLKNRK